MPQLSLFIRTHPDENHIFPEQVPDNQNFNKIETGSIVYVPAPDYHNIEKNTVDLLTNFFSLGGMKKETFSRYTNSVLFQNAKKLYLVNRFVGSLVFEPTYEGDINILDYQFESAIVKYLDIFPIHHYLLVRKKFRGGRNSEMPIPPILK